MKNVVLYATDTMSDWEYGYLVAGLAMAEAQMPGRYRLRVLGAPGKQTVRTLGGLGLLVDGAVTEAAIADTAVLVLPGAETWESGHEEVLDLARRCLAAGVPVAGICGATFGLARIGLLDDRAHTSNAPEFLAASGYGGASRYREEKTVVDRQLITAPATAPVDFARAVFEALELFPAPIIEAWHGLYTTGERRYFDQLMGAGA
ncbi:DJ-1/PfpI family protein [Cryptosporangium minutisporangium]|uniref:Type 1 glutamine amidotransferase family protein n=1 Tax=Cryptosporangium minutisporangium TaxID=113569 RepID=A0ABP6SPZ9_9ACTN